MLQSQSRRQYSEQIQVGWMLNFQMHGKRSLLCYWILNFVYSCPVTDAKLNK